MKLDNWDVGSSSALPDGSYGSEQFRVFVSRTSRPEVKSDGLQVRSSIEQIGQKRPHVFLQDRALIVVGPLTLVM